MRILKFTAVAMLCVASYLAGSCGKGKYYDDASRMAGLIRCYEDHLGSDDPSIEDYGCFEELEGIFLYDDGLGEAINLDDYSYSY